LLIEISHVGFQTVFLRIDLQKDSAVHLLLAPSIIRAQEVVITGARSQAPDETTYNIAQFSQAELAQMGGISIADALSRVPGVSQLTTGAGIAKPVIRGLYGNRIQVNVNGLRFDNQQWQDEHGLGLSDMGVERVEVIRGPASVLYGSDAMGGVINIIEERPAPASTRVSDLHARLYANTYGMSLNYGFKSSAENKWKKFRVGFDNHADYADGNNRRVLNSRFASYNLKAAWGKNKTNSTHVFSITASHSLFGFVFDSLARKQKDARLSRTFDGPHHAVSFLQASHENTYYKGSRTIKFNAGLTSNLRLEDEGGGGISLSMLLNSGHALLQLAQPVGHSALWTYGGSLFFQTNTNFGGRIIIPDAINGEASAFSHYHLKKNRWLLEGGLRYDKKLIETFPTHTLNIVGNDSPTEEIVPFTHFYDALNFSLAVGYDITRALRVTINASSAYRPGNLAELSSNGLHEGTLRWEIGMSDARIEQNVNIEGALSYSTPALNARLSLYHNDFSNFIYLASTGTEYFGFSVYHFRQSDATLKGGEFSIDWNIPASPVELNGSYSFIDASKNDGEPLPFIPANKLSAEFKLHVPSQGVFTNALLKAGCNYTFDQDRPAEFETSTSGYLLIHAGIFASWRKYNLSLACNNLLNEDYYDHLSRFKYYGIANMGRSIVLGLNFKF
jgi:iron complex outermembrane recepter protein